MVEIGCIELINHVPTGVTLHLYMNPEREMEQAAFEVHGLSTEFLQKYPPFRDQADEIREFLAEDTLIIHNAAFDMKFLNAEFRACGRPPLPMEQAVDTVRLARQKYPGAQVSLDALCRRFEIDNTHRDLHGALVDADLLASVYLELIGGRQPGLELASSSAAADRIDMPGPAADRADKVFREPRPHRPNAAEQEAHAAFLAKIKSPIWSDGAESAGD